MCRAGLAYGMIAAYMGCGEYNWVGEGHLQTCLILILLIFPLEYTSTLTLCHLGYYITGGSRLMLMFTICQFPMKPYWERRG